MLFRSLDVVTPERFIRQISPAGKQIIANELLQKSDLVPLTWKKEFAKEVFKNAGIEGLTEGAQQALQNYGSELAGSPNKLFSQASIDSIIDASIRGTVGGTLFGSPGAAFEANRSKQARQALIDKQQADEQRQQQILANQQLLYPTSIVPQEGGTTPTAIVGQPPIQVGEQAQFNLPPQDQQQTQQQTQQQQVQQQTSPLTAEVRQAPIIAGEQAQFGLGQLEQQLLKLLEQQQIQQDIQTKNKQQTTENIRKGNLNSTPVPNATVESIKIGRAHV